MLIQQKLTSPETIFSVFTSLHHFLSFYQNDVKSNKTGDDENEKVMDVETNKEKEAEDEEEKSDDEPDEDITEEAAENLNKNMDHIYIALTTRILPRLHKFFTKKVKIIHMHSL